jgi:hypothetical protein
MGRLNPVDWFVHLGGGTSAGNASMGIELDEAVLKLECDGPDHEDGSTRKAWFSCGSYDNCVDMALRCGWIEQQGGWICPHCARAPQEKISSAYKDNSRQQRPLRSLKL